MSKTGAAFSVRFLRNGDQITIVRNIITSGGQGGALFQVVDPTSGTIKPDWKVADNQPIIQIGARSAAGYPVSITDVRFAFDGTTLNFTYNGTEWVNATNDKYKNIFQSRIKEGKYELKIVDNIASEKIKSNKQISYEVDYVSNAMSDSVQGSVDVLIQQRGSDSHILQITTNRVELDESNDRAILTAKAMYGTEDVTIGSNGYGIEWYQDGAKLEGQTASTLTVTRGMVTGGSIFIAKLTKDGSVVAQDGQRINDIADEYQIAYTPTDAGSNFVSPTHNATYTLSIERNGTPYGGSASFAWQVYNALGVAKSSGTGSTVTVRPSDCLVGSGESAYYADCDVQVTADF